MAEDLLAVVRTYRDLVTLVVSPLMTGGSYQGWLPEEMWKVINERTQQQGILSALGRASTRMPPLASLLGNSNEEK